MLHIVYENKGTFTVALNAVTIGPSTLVSTVIFVIIFAQVFIAVNNEIKQDNIDQNDKHRYATYRFAVSALIPLIRRKRFIKPAYARYTRNSSDIVEINRKILIETLHNHLQQLSKQTSFE